MQKCPIQEVLITYLKKAKWEELTVKSLDVELSQRWQNQLEIELPHDGQNQKVVRHKYKNVPNDKKTNKKKHKVVSFNPITLRTEIKTSFEIGKYLPTI